jgi:hypothetical protein
VIRGPTELSFVVDQRPGYVEIDPRMHRIDRNPDNNAREIEQAK